MQKTIVYQIIRFFLLALTFTEAGPDSAQLQFINDTNNLRYDYANDKNIVNMFKLEYSDQLSQIAHNYVSGENPGGRYQSWRIVEIKDYENGAKELNQTFSDWSKSDEVSKLNDSLTGKNENVREMEHLVPLQREIGCAENPKSSSGLKICCILGPEGTLKSFSFGPQGISGEKCKEFDGYTELDGLCILKRPDPTTSISQSRKTDAPKTTEETELDRLIKKYQAEEQDGDVYDEDFPTTVVSLKNSVSGSLKMAVIFLILGFI